MGKNVRGLGMAWPRLSPGRHATTGLRPQQHRTCRPALGAGAHPTRGVGPRGRPPRLAARSAYRAIGRLLDVFSGGRSADAVCPLHRTVPVARPRSPHCQRRGPSPALTSKVYDRDSPSATAALSARPRSEVDRRGSGDALGVGDRRADRLRRVPTSLAPSFPSGAVAEATGRSPVGTMTAATQMIATTRAAPRRPALRRTVGGVLLTMRLGVARQLVRSLCDKLRRGMSAPQEPERAKLLRVTLISPIFIGRPVAICVQARLR